MSRAQDFVQKDIDVIDVEISSGETTSDAVNLYGVTPVGFILPAGMTSTQLSFEVSADNSTFVSLVDMNNQDVSYVIGSTATAAHLDPNIFVGWKYIKFKAGSAEGADRTIKLMTYPV